MPQKIALTSDEIAQRGRELAAKHLEFTEEEAAQKTTKSLLKQRLDQIVDDMERLAKEIRTGEAELDDQPELPLDAVRVDGGEIAAPADGEGKTSANAPGQEFIRRNVSDSIVGEPSSAKG